MCTKRKITLWALAHALGLTLVLFAYRSGSILLRHGRAEPRFDVSATWGNGVLSAAIPKSLPISDAGEVTVEMRGSEPSPQADISLQAPGFEIILVKGLPRFWVWKIKPKQAGIQTVVVTVAGLSDFQWDTAGRLRDANVNVRGNSLVARVIVLTDLGLTTGQDSFLKGLSGILGVLGAILGYPFLKRKLETVGQVQPRLPRLEKFALASHRGYVVVSNEPALVVDQIQRGTFPVFDVGMSNTSENAIYVTALRFFVTAYSREEVNSMSGAIIAAISIVLTDQATEDDLEGLLVRFHLSLQRRWGRLCEVKAPAFFTEDDVATLRQSPLLSNVEVTVVGEGYTKLEPSDFVRAPRSFKTTSGDTVEMQVNLAIRPHSVDRFQFLLRFDEPGSYDLGGRIVCGGSGDIELSTFRIMYRGN